VFRSHTYLSGPWTWAWAVISAFFFALLSSCLGPDLEPPFSGGENDSEAEAPTGVNTSQTANTGGTTSSAAGSGHAAAGGGGVGGNVQTRAGARADDQVDADAGVAGAGP
jgi:hypothetical protein